MRSLLQRLSLALEAPAHMTIGPSAQAAALDAGQQAGAGAQLGAPGSRLTSAGGLSSISSSHAADGLRHSGEGSLGSAGHQRRPSRDHGLDSVAQQRALASKAQRSGARWRLAEVVRCMQHVRACSSACVCVHVCVGVVCVQCCVSC